MFVYTYFLGGPAVSLAFQQQTYHAEVAENPISGEDITKVHAVRLVFLSAFCLLLIIYYVGSRFLESARACSMTLAASLFLLIIEY